MDYIYQNSEGNCKKNCLFQYSGDEINQNDGLFHPVLIITLQFRSKPELLGGSVALDKVDKSPKTYA